MSIFKVGWTGTIVAYMYKKFGEFSDSHLEAHSINKINQKDLTAEYKAN